jgi:hypothetical protein
MRPNTNSTKLTLNMALPTSSQPTPRLTAAGIHGRPTTCIPHLAVGLACWFGVQTSPRKRAGKVCGLRGTGNRRDWGPTRRIRSKVAQNGHEAVVKLLLERGAEVKAATNKI